MWWYVEPSQLPLTVLCCQRHLRFHASPCVPKQCLQSMSKNIQPRCLTNWLKILARKIDHMFAIVSISNELAHFRSNSNPFWLKVLKRSTLAKMRHCLRCFTLFLLLCRLFSECYNINVPLFEFNFLFQTFPNHQTSSIQESNFQGVSPSDWRVGKMTSSARLCGLFSAIEMWMSSC